MMTMDVAEFGAIGCLTIQTINGANAGWDQCGGTSAFGNTTSCGLFDNFLHIKCLNLILFPRAGIQNS